MTKSTVHDVSPSDLDAAPASSSPNPLMLTWKDSRQMAQYTTETGKLLPRKYTRLSAKQQRHMKRQVKRARNMLVMP